MTREERVALALIESEKAAERVRAMKASALHKPPRAATRFPFKHRTVAEIDAAQEVARRRHRTAYGLNCAIEYGFDPNSLKVEGGR